VDPELLSLTNIGNGGLVEVFDREISKVIENISDVNTSSEKKRKIQIEVIFKPYEDRSGAEIEFSCKATLCGVPAAKTRMFITGKGSVLRAYGHDPRQMSLLAQPAAGINQ
jgi:hypothetical protein